MQSPLQELWNYHLEQVERKAIAVRNMKESNGIPDYPKTTHVSKSKDFEKMDYELRDVKPRMMVLNRINDRTFEDEPVYEFAHVNVWDGFKHILVETNYDYADDE